MGKTDRKGTAGINERLGALERELIGLEDMLEDDEAWRALTAEAERATRSGAKTSALSRLKKALEANPIYQARRKLLEAISALRAQEPAAALPRPSAARIAAATGATKAAATSPPPLPSDEARYGAAFDVGEAEVVIVTREAMLPALAEEAKAETEAFEMAPPSERSLRGRLAAARAPQGFDGEGYAAYAGAIEEASVEIITADEIAQREAAATPAPRSSRRRPTIVKRD